MITIAYLIASLALSATNLGDFEVWILFTAGIVDYIAAVVLNISSRV